MGRRIAVVAALLAAGAFLVPLTAVLFVPAQAVVSGGAPSQAALAEIPPDFLRLYRGAAQRCPGMSWSVLAAVGHVESGHGVNLGPSSAGALGPMQFLPSTWEAFAVDADGDGVGDIMSPADSIAGAADYLCSNGGGEPLRLRSALWNYNHSYAYVELVLSHATRFGELYARTGGVGVDLIQNPNVTLTAAAQDDLRAGIVDPRIVAVLQALAARHTLHVSVLRTGHSPYVAGTNRFSNHWFGRGVDIFRIDGQLVTPSSAAARTAVLELLALPEGSVFRPDELGHPWPDLEAEAGSFSNAAHLDHIHIGWHG